MAATLPLKEPTGLLTRFSNIVAANGGKLAQKTTPPLRLLPFRQSKEDPDHSLRLCTVRQRLGRLLKLLHESCRRCHSREWLGFLQSRFRLRLDKGVHRVSYLWFFNSEYTKSDSPQSVLVIRKRRPLYDTSRSRNSFQSVFSAIVVVDHFDQHVDAFFRGPRLVVASVSTIRIRECLELGYDLFHNASLPSGLADLFRTGLDNAFHPRVSFHLVN